MRALGNNPKGLSHAAIAQAVDLPRSTVQRIITALEEERLVESIGPQGGFRLGTALGLLINQTQTDIISSVQPFLIELGQLLNESVTLSSLIGDKVYVIDRVVAERELRIVFPIGINPHHLQRPAARYSWPNCHLRTSKPSCQNSCRR